LPEPRLRRSVLKSVASQHLDCDLAPQVNVTAYEHPGAATPADLAFEHVTFTNRSRHEIQLRCCGGGQ
jgi:hypothetical protein